MPDQTPQPPAVTPRGFAMWADFTDLYGAHITVQQSSLATQDAVWVGAGADRGHLSVEQARIVYDALGAFLTAAEEPPPDRPHTYLSTSCRHDEHDYCQSTSGQQGTKTPATCKFCTAPCVCPCHQTTTDV